MLIGWHQVQENHVPLLSLQTMDADGERGMDPSSRKLSITLMSPLKEQTVGDTTYEEKYSLAPSANDHFH